MHEHWRFRLLRLILFLCAATWGVAAVGVFLPWETATNVLEGLGTRPISYDPMLNYWLRMAAGAFGLIGLGYLFVALKPQKYVIVLPYCGWLMLIEGFVLLSHGIRLHLPPFPFYGDVSACLLAGVGILLLKKSAQEVT
jgi:hypothetical protein